MHLVSYHEVSLLEGDGLAALRVDAMRESLIRVGRFDPMRARERFLSGFSPAHTKHVVVAGERVGFVVLRPVELDLQLDHLYIHPEHQGRGIGSTVMTWVLAQADRQGKTVRVVALKDSRSNAFYAAHGFSLVEQSEWDNHYVRNPSVPSGAAPTSAEASP